MLYVPQNCGPPNDLNRSIFEACWVHKDPPIISRSPVNTHQQTIIYQLLSGKLTVRYGKWRQFIVDLPIKIP